MSWFKLLLEVAKPHKKSWILGGVGLSLGDLAFVFLVKELFNKLSNETNEAVSNDFWVVWILAGLGLVIVRSSSYFLFKQAQAKVKMDWIYKLRELVLLNRASIENRIKSGEKTEEINQRISVWTKKMESALSFVPLFYQSILVVVLIVPVLFYLSPLMSSLMVLIYLGFLTLLVKKVKGFKKEIQPTIEIEEKAKIKEWSFFSFFGTWVNSTLEDSTANYSREMYQQEHDHSIKFSHSKNQVSAISEAMVSFLVVVILGVSAYLIYNEPSMAVDLMTFCSALIVTYKPLKESSRLYPDFQEGLMAFSNWSGLVLKGKNEKAKVEIETVDAESIFINDLEIGYESGVVWGPKSLEFKIDSPLWISGKNGVGKSTLMKSIIGRAMIYSGAIRVSEKINLDQISLVGQQPFLPLVDQNTLSEIEANPNFKTFKSLFEIESVFNKYSEDLRSFCESNFSGGEIQRLCIFLVLMTKVKWLILDEPFSGLPQADRLKLISAVKDFCLQQQITFWVVSHDDLIGFERLDLNEV